MSKKQSLKFRLVSNAVAQWMQTESGKSLVTALIKCLFPVGPKMMKLICETLWRCADTDLWPHMLLVDNMGSMIGVTQWPEQWEKSLYWRTRWTELINQNHEQNHERKKNGYSDHESFRATKITKMHESHERTHGQGKKGRIEGRELRPWKPPDTRTRPRHTLCATHCADLQNYQQPSRKVIWRHLTFHLQKFESITEGRAGSFLKIIDSG